MTLQKRRTVGMLQDAICFFFSSCLFKYAYHAILFIHLSICLRNDRVSDRPVNLSVFLHAHYPPLSPISRVTPLQ